MLLTINYVVEHLRKSDVYTIFVSNKIYNKSSFIKYLRCHSNELSSENVHFWAKYKTLKLRYNYVGFVK